MDVKLIDCGNGAPEPNTEFANIRDKIMEAAPGKIKRNKWGCLDDRFSARPSDEGTVAMLDFGNADTCGSIFIINVVDNGKVLDTEVPNSNPPKIQSRVFGKVTDKDGLDMLTRISEAEAEDDIPLYPIIVKSIFVSGAGLSSEK